MREPLAGRETVLPVADDVRHPLASPRAAVDYLVHAATLEAARLGDWRALTMPGLSVTVAEQIEALRELAGDRAVALIRREHDPVIAGIVAGWPRAFATERAAALGFRGESTFAEILAAHVQDELGGDRAGDRVTRIGVITGGGSGIGRAAAAALAADGWTVVLAGRRAAALEQAAAAIGAAAVPVPCDVTDPGSVRALFDVVRERFGRLDLLVNNAGIGAPAVPLEDLDAGAVASRRRHQPDGRVPVHAGGVPDHDATRPRGGRIINNGSISAMSPRPLSAAYTATKHAIAGLTKSTSLDGRRYDIACGEIDIGNAEHRDDGADGRGRAAGRRARRPWSRRSTWPHVGAAVAYMASLPLDANVQSMTVMATKMPFVGRG